METLSAIIIHFRDFCTDLSLCCLSRQKIYRYRTIGVNIPKMSAFRNSKRDRLFQNAFLKICKWHGTVGILIDFKVLTIIKVILLTNRQIEWLFNTQRSGYQNIPTRKCHKSDPKRLKTVVPFSALQDVIDYHVVLRWHTNSLVRHWESKGKGRWCTDTITIMNSLTNMSFHFVNVPYLSQFLSVIPLGLGCRQFHSRPINLWIEHPVSLTR